MVDHRLGDVTLGESHTIVPHEFVEEFRISGISVQLTANGEVWCEGRNVGRVVRENRFDQWFWRAYDPGADVQIKRFFTSRPEAIQLLLLRADLIEGIGF